MYRKVWIALIALPMLSGACFASSIAYSRVKVGRVTAHVVTADLSNPEVRVTVALAKGGAGRQESFKSMINRVKPAAAITGTFFDTRTLIPTGDIALYGTIVHSGCIGSALCIDSKNKACIVSLKDGRKNGWAGYETVLCAGPRLVDKGKIAIALKKEGFRSSLCAPARRTAVGITGSGKLLIVAINHNASLHDTARMLVSLGAQEGLCLDGGSSTAFYHTGRFVSVPSRLLTNCLVIYSGKAVYQAAKANLAPATYFAKLPVAAVQHEKQAVPTLPLITMNYLTTPIYEAPAEIWAAR